MELFCNAQQYNQTGMRWPTAFWLAALKTDGPITGNITGSCHIRE